MYPIGMFVHKCGKKRQNIISIRPGDKKYWLPLALEQACTTYDSTRGSNMASGPNVARWRFISGPQSL